MSKFLRFIKLDYSTHLQIDYLINFFIMIGLFTIENQKYTQSLSQYYVMMMMHGFYTVWIPQQLINRIHSLLLFQLYKQSLIGF